MGAYPGITLSSAGVSAPVRIDITSTYNPYLGSAPSWSLGLCATVSNGGSLSYNVQITCDQVPSDSGNWNNHDVLKGQTASANGNISFPITGIRLQVTSHTSGSVTLGICQWP